MTSQITSRMPLYISSLALLNFTNDRGVTVHEKHGVTCTGYQLYDLERNDHQILLCDVRLIRDTFLLLFIASSFFQGTWRHKVFKKVFREIILNSKLQDKCRGLNLATLNYANTLGRKMCEKYEQDSAINPRHSNL